MEEEITNLKKYVDISERNIEPWNHVDGLDVMESGQVEGGKDVTIS